MHAQPAFAGRTVIDGGATFDITGYCSPNTAGPVAGPCTANPLPNAINLGGTPYDFFYVNSNGTVSFGSIETFLEPQNSATPPPPVTNLADFGVPIFSPNFVDGPGFEDTLGGSGFDGAFVADTSLTAAGFSINFYTCADTLNCGSRSANLIQSATFSQDDFDNQTGLSFAIAQSSTLNDPNASDEANFESGRAFLLQHLPIYNITLSELLGGGFQVNYNYNDAAEATTGTYGFSLPTAQLQVTGPLRDQSFLFDSAGNLVSSVPEPSTWMSMLLGFGLAGFAMRRQRRSHALA